METELCRFSGRQLQLLIQSHLWIVQVRVVTAVNFFRDVTLADHQVKGVFCYGRTFLITVSPKNRFTVKKEASREYQEINYTSTDWSRVCFLLCDRPQPFAFVEPLPRFSHFHTCVSNFHIDMFSPSWKQ